MNDDQHQTTSPVASASPAPSAPTASPEQSAEARLHYLFRHSERAGIVHPLWQAIFDEWAAKDSP